MRRRFVRSLYVAAYVCLGYWLFVTADGCWSQATLSRRLDELDIDAQGARRTRLEARHSGLVGRIEIARLGLRAIVVEGTSGAPLRRGVGHLRGSAYPGERGNVVLAGHRDSYFSRLNGVRTGDRVTLTTLDGTFEYRVDSTLVVPPNRTDLIAPTGGRALTLVTCYPFDWIGPAPDRFVVRSSLSRADPGNAAPRRAARPQEVRMAVAPPVAR